MKRGLDRKLCATCEFWTGNRDATFDAKGNPKLDVFDKDGNCENINSRFFDQIRNLDKNCCCFSKWTELL